MEINDNKRFSVLLLENDVTEYTYFKKKYNEYYQKVADTKISTWMSRKYHQKRNIEKKKYYYNKYINKMKYLEEHYRSIFNYTKYHSQLENTTIVPSSEYIVDAYYKDNNEFYKQNPDFFDM